MTGAGTMGRGDVVQFATRHRGCTNESRKGGNEGDPDGIGHTARPRSQRSDHRDRQDTPGNASRTSMGRMISSSTSRRGSPQSSRGLTR